MGCGCRGGTKRSSRSTPPKTPVRSKQQSTCRRLEVLGNLANISIGTGGRLFLASPLGTGSGLSVSSLLPSLGCGGAFATSIKNAEVKTLIIFSSPNKANKFRSLVPGSTVKLGYLRSVLRQF